MPEFTEVAQPEVLPPRDRDAAGRFLPAHSIGINTRWRISGNPAGNPRARREFEQAFYAALMGEGTPDEAAKLLWESARKHEPWAVQLLLQRLAPHTPSLRLVHETREDEDGIDYSRLTDEQLEQLESILTAVGVRPREIEGGEGAAAIAQLHSGDEV
jgi:hypothetical protein